jgi:hypothetical protein
MEPALQPSSLTIQGPKENTIAKQPPRHGKPWTRQEEQKLQMLVDQNTPTRVMGIKLQRTEVAVRNKSSELEISLKPTNQSPYNRRK